MSKKKIIATSVLSLAMCASVITGATYALFTSESETNISINAGNVKLVATLNLTGTSSMGVDMPKGTFENGGTASIDKGTITLERMTPGDKAEFEILLDNQSNVAIQYQTIVKQVSDTGLFDGLVIMIEGEEFTTTKVYDWVFLAEKEQPADNVIEVSVELPEDAGNEYKGTSTQLSVAVNAVQGNATTENPDVDTTYIYTASDLVSFAKSVNAGNNYSGKTVMLADDIDLAGIEWTPIGQTGATTFSGVFDGQEHTISNLNVDISDLTGNDDGAGLFGWIEEHTASVQIKNVNIDKANVKGHQYAGGLVGYIGGAGAHVISDCSVTNSTLEANKSVGAIFGHTATNVLTVSKVTATDNIIIGALSGREFGVGAIFGRSNGGSVTTMSKVTVEDNVISQEGATSAQVSDYYGTCYGTFVLDGKVSALTSSSEELSNLFSVGDSVTLKNGEFSNAISVPDGKELVVEDIQLDSYNNYDIGVSVGKNSTVTINGGIIKAFEYAQVIAASNGAKIVVKDGNYTGGMAVMPSENVDVIIDGGTFDLELVLIGESSPATGSKIVITGGNFTVPTILNNAIAIEITGGTFNIENITEYENIKDYITITGGTFSVDPSDYLTADYIAEQNDAGMWIVSAKI